MANILNSGAFFYKFGSSRKQKQKPLEAEYLNFRVLMDCSNQKKVKGSNIVKCAQKKHFSYIIDKIVLLRRNFSKAFVCPGFYCRCFYYFY